MKAYRIIVLVSATSAIVSLACGQLGGGAATLTASTATLAPTLAVTVAPTGTPTMIINAGTPPATAASTSATSTGIDCDNAYLPVVDGASWSYNGSGTGGSFKRTDMITAGTDDFVIETVLSKVSYLESWDCIKEGLISLQPDAGVLSAIFQGPNGLVKVETLSVTGVTIPQTITTGDQWEQVITFSYSASKSAGTGTLTHDFTAMGPDRVSVPAGTFSVMRLDVQSTMTITTAGATGTVTFDSTQWLAPGSGLVKMAGSGNAMGTKFESNLDLTAFSWRSAPRLP